MNKKFITAESLLIENSENGILGREELNKFINSLSENDILNFNKFLRHVHAGHPINFNQRRMIDRGGRPYYFVNQDLNGSARTGYKLMIFEGFDLLLERLAFESLGFATIEDLKKVLDN